MPLLNPMEAEQDLANRDDNDASGLRGFDPDECRCDGIVCPHCTYLLEKDPNDRY